MPSFDITSEVDAQEMDRWWWNRDRSKEEILTSTRHILGSASEAERLSIDAAYGRMFTTGNAEGEVGQNNLARFYGEGGAGYDIANWVKFGGKNLLEVTVSKESEDASVNLAERRADYWNFGGIFRPVYLELKPAQYIDRVATDA